MANNSLTKIQENILDSDKIDLFPEEQKKALKLFNKYLEFINNSLTSEYKEGPKLQIVPVVLADIDLVYKRGASKFLLYLIYKKEWIFNNIKKTIGYNLSSNDFIKEKLIEFHPDDFLKLVEDLNNIDKKLEKLDDTVNGIEFKTKLYDVIENLEFNINYYSNYKYSELLSKFHPIE